jgi:hypothetical protein
MSDEGTAATSDLTARRVSRRTFIKGVITSGVAVSSVSYLFRANLSGQGTAGLGERLITFNVNGQRAGATISAVPATSTSIWASSRLGKSARTWI